MYCDGDLGTFFLCLKSIFNALKFIIPIILILYISLDLFKLVLTKSDDKKKQYKKAIHTRIVCGILIFLVPTFIFMIIKMVVGNDISGIELISGCWNAY